MSESLSAPAEGVNAGTQASAEAEGQPEPDHPTQSESEQGGLVLGSVVRINNFSANIFFFDVLAGQHTASFVLRVGSMYQSKPLSSASLHTIASTISEGVRVRVAFDSNEEQAQEKVTTHRAACIQVLPATASPAQSSAPDIVPVVENGVGKGSVNLHRRPKQGWCKYWLNSKRCPLENCTQPHPVGDAWKQSRKEWHLARAKRRKLEAKKRAALIGEDSSVLKHHKDQRASLLCNWLIEHVGISTMNEGSGVLDIAGGKGDLSRSLSNAGIKNTVIDPRQCYKRDGTLANASQSHLLVPFDDDFIANPEYGDLLSRTSLMLGMHPDQATEYIFDYAIERKIPFVVVPCCVFRRQLGGHRRVVDMMPWARPPVRRQDKVVATYEEFLDYLQAKDCRIRRHFLPFHGRNCVLALLEY